MCRIIGDITAKYYLESMTQKLYRSWI